MGRDKKSLPIEKEGEYEMLNFYITAENAEFETVYETVFSSETVSAGIAELRRRMDTSWKNFIKNIRVIEVSNDEEYLGYFVRNTPDEKFIWEW